ncbi:unnamed protein product [Symbiodinium sp. KB8]|nr:unnamed protein product [Symbiodinium sp. KB8]
MRLSRRSAARCARIGALGLLLVVAWAVQGGRAAAGAGDDGGGDVLAIAQSVMAKVRDLQAQVQTGDLVPNFGEKAASIVAEARQGGADLEKAVEGALEPLFIKQIHELKSKHATSDVPCDLDAVDEEEKKFKAEAAELSTGSTWNYEPERRRLRAQLDQKVDAEAALAEERARAAVLQRSTLAVVLRLQDQMQDLAAKAQAVRDGNSPFVLSTSYRIPNTPLQFVSRYEQGRANIELTLTPDKDPTKSEGGFAEAVGPANIGVSFDVGV